MRPAPGFRVRWSLVLAGTLLGLAGCGNSGTPASSPPPQGAVILDRYAAAQGCYALRSVASGRFLGDAGSGYAGGDATLAERFFFKPAALGEYLLYGRDRQLLAADAAPASQTLDSVDEAAVWELRVVGDATAYPAAPQFDRKPAIEALRAYRGFVDPLPRGSRFWLASADGRRLALDSGGARLEAASESSAQQFELQLASDCAAFPEADTDTQGQTFAGTLPDGRVLGFADVHNHISATTFLGGAHFGAPFHRFGVRHAVGDCEDEHGPNGVRDAVGALLAGDFDGHDTAGWPTFPDWPAPRALTHEGTYWKWIERAWIAGLRVLVNDLVENETLCELRRNVSGNPTRSCNEMANVLDQIGTMYAMQDYIDAQSGGRGAGWWRIVESPAEARAVIAAGKLAVVLGIENSHLFNCKLTYSPLRTELGEAANTVDCAISETGAPNEVATQLAEVLALGVRQIFPIHEFDNALGGNGIFDTLVLNVGNRSDTGGIPGDELALVTAAAEDPAQAAALAGLVGAETPTGEFWTTYDCPRPEAPTVGGYLYAPGANLTAIPPGGLCADLNFDGRPGGPTGCYPNDPERPQCNARWLTDIGLYTLSRLMESGVMIELDHMELEIKSQTLDLAEAQNPVYPLVSTHSGQGGISNVQARRVLAGGGIVYPIKRNSRIHLDTWQRTRTLYAQTDRRHPFAYGYGADTNGLATQTLPRGDIEPGKELRYPFTFFKGPVWDQIPEFAAVQPVVFEASSMADAETGEGRRWHLDEDGAAHYGMIADAIEELRIEGGAELIRDTYLSAEVYLQMWERTEAAAAAIRRQGLQVPDGLLRQPPPPEG
ncbi:MAG TPA: hypothetical protein VFV27_07665 [Nevskiaceae bacterium]|nr:hypothetical protein [Nevskiaceae bacterium]